MRVLVQRVKSAAVVIKNEEVCAIARGLLLLVGIGREDNTDDVVKMARKVLCLRIFEDDAGKMNLNIKNAGGDILSVPQFTLYADVKRGNRPGFDRSADPAFATAHWRAFNELLRDEGLLVQEGVFGAHMEVGLVNNGPVTIWLDSRD